MKTVFADTLFWIAILNPKDSCAEAARKAEDSLGEGRIVTTDEVLTEFLAGLSNRGKSLRLQAAKMVRAILENPNVNVVPQSHDSFLNGVDLYEQRCDKSYSLTDCISMTTMRSESLTEVLTNDHHFEQESFTILMRRA